jgi:hypothetical protein
MPSIDANDTDFAPPLPKCCEKCTAEMKLLGAFPAIALHMAVKIFRCNVCNNVISEAT